METPGPEKKSVPFWEAFGFWLKLGFISFGGPAGQIAIMHQELVEKKKWISEKRFLHALNYCMVIPGPEAQQLATYIGWLLHRTPGGIIAGSLFVLPSLVILTLLSWIYVSFGQVPVIQGVFYGIKSAVIGLLASALYRIGSRTLKTPVLWIIAASAFAVIFFFNVSFLWIVIGAGAVGILGRYVFPKSFHPNPAKSEGSGLSGPSLIDDDSPLSHTQFSWLKIVKYGVIGLLLWAVPIIILTVLFGWTGTLPQMGWFFTQAALVTFGGAYAVLPFVFQGSVGIYGWISPGQMIDGLALGETTPGPLIMVVTFIGFLGGWSKLVFGPDLQLFGAIAGGLVATWFTFLPSFLFILIGGPFIESTKGDLRWSAPLTAVTASVVGVIFNLALFFSYHVLWPLGFSAFPEWRLMILACAAGLALMLFKRNSIEVILGCAVLGLGIYLLFP